MREVRLTVQAGDTKVEVGTAALEPVAGGDTVVDMTITHPALVQLLGGNHIRGTVEMPPLTEEPPSE